LHNDRQRRRAAGFFIHLIRAFELHFNKGDLDLASVKYAILASLRKTAPCARRAASKAKTVFFVSSGGTSMASPRVPLSELAAAVQAAVQKVLVQQGTHYPIWCGVFPPVELATEANAAKIASEISRDAGGVRVTPSVGQVSAAAGERALTHPKIIGLVFDPHSAK
jgi:hypothetical protein